MITATISEKGQITLPVGVRKKLGLVSKQKVELVLSDNQVAVKPIMKLADLSGIFAEYAKNVTDDWETIRNKMEEAVAREVEDESRR